MKSLISIKISISATYATDDITDVTINLNLQCYEVDEHLQTTLWNSGFLRLHNLDKRGKLKTSTTQNSYDPIKPVLSIVIKG